MSRLDEIARRLWSRLRLDSPPSRSFHTSGTTLSSRALLAPRRRLSGDSDVCRASLPPCNTRARFVLAVPPLFVSQHPPWLSPKGDRGFFSPITWEIVLRCWRPRLSARVRSTRIGRVERADGSGKLMVPLGMLLRNEEAARRGAWYLR